MRFPNPAKISIEGVGLTYQQADVIRVAVTHMDMELSDPEFRQDVGGELADSYQIHLRAVLRLILGLPQRK